MPAVDILMATYNGGKYISEQIDSLLAQTFTDWRLLIRDDGSSDNTPAIIEGYAAEYPGKIQVIHDNETCRSATRNFFELLKHASADYVMFCDQDDVWLKHKIEITYDCMRKTERENPGVPVMVFTGLQVVDAELRSLDYLMGMDVPERTYTFRELVSSNRASGCTQMLNRKCWSGLGEYQDGIIYHDWWSALYAAAFGVVVRVPMALILYRQHGGNVESAMPDQASWGERIMRYLLHPFARASYINRKTRIMAEIFRERFSASLSPVKLSEVNMYLDTFGKSIFTRFRAVMKCRDIYFFQRHPFIKYRLIFLGNK